MIPDLLENNLKYGYRKPVIYNNLENLIWRCRDLIDL
nr:MAG TPA: hypothetical protein [Caudoviricetes sp.]